MSGFARRAASATWDAGASAPPGFGTSLPSYPAWASPVTAMAAANVAPAGRATPTPTLDRLVGPTATPAAPTPQPAGPKTDLGANRPEQAGRLQRVYDANQRRIETAKEKPTRQQAASRDQFLDHYEQNRARYDAVAEERGVPAELVAALHWRESTGNFGTYLHNGDKLGKPTTHVPRNIPTFQTWEPSANHALGRFSSLQGDLGITKDTKDMAALATYAEHYNGLGYHNKGRVSPYVHAGNDTYRSGKYVADGRYSSTHVDQQPGVVFLMQGIREREAAKAREAAANAGRS